MGKDHNSKQRKERKKKRRSVDSTDGRKDGDGKKKIRVDESDSAHELLPDCLESCDDHSSSTVDLDLARRVFLKMAKRKSKNDRKKKKESEQSTGDIKPLKPTQAQLKSWPILLSRNDGYDSAASPVRHKNLICIAPTGSGKTLAYGIPLVQNVQRKLMQDINGRRDLSRVLGLVLVPTRELALQVSRELEKVAKIANKKNGDKKKDSAQIDIVPIHGGVDKQGQLKRIRCTNNSGQRRGVIIAATTGRLVDLMNCEAPTNGEEDTDSEEHGTLLSSVSFLVIDEADRMVLSGEICAQVDEILGVIPGHQRKGSSAGDFTMCLFSATLPDRVLSKVDDWVGRSRDVIYVDKLSVGKGGAEKESDSTEKEETPASETMAVDGGIDSQDQDKSSKSENSVVADEEAALKKKVRSGPLDLSAIPSNVSQVVHVCSIHKKPKKLLGMLGKIRKEESKEGQGRTKGLCIIFFGKIKTLKYICCLLQKDGHKCVELHSNIDQAARERTVFEFKSGKIPTMLATDIAARGIHIKNVRYVINYDFPGALEQYVHRCGRAGRDKDQATVYSYFNREMKAMAADLILLLTSTNAWVDPNLRLLVGDKDGDNIDIVSDGKKKRKRQKSDSNSSKPVSAPAAINKIRADISHNNKELSEEDWDGDAQFSSLAANRIVLKRAAHVSDADDSSDDDGE